MTQILIVGAGGFFGSIFRYGIGVMFKRVLPAVAFPLGTLTANLSGCFIIGLLYGVVEAKDAFGPNLRLFLFVGMLGGFTTFSSFGYETFALARNTEMLKAAGNVLVHIVVGLAAVGSGFMLSKMI